MKKSVILCAVLAALLTAGSSAPADDQLWKNVGSDWGTVANWTSAVPGSGDNAVFSATTGAPGYGNIPTLGGSFAVQGLVITNSTSVWKMDASVAGATLTLGVNGYVQLNSGGGANELGDGVGTEPIISLAVPQSWLVLSRALWARGKLTGDGALLKHGGSELRFFTATADYKGPTVITQGSVWMDGATYKPGAGAPYMESGELRLASNQKPAAGLAAGVTASALRAGLAPGVFTVGGNPLQSEVAPYLAAECNGVLGLRDNQTNPLDLSALGGGKMFLGAGAANITYNATLTPASDNIYRLGGGGYRFQVSAANTLTGARDVLIGSPYDATFAPASTVAYDRAQNYTGTTTVNSGAKLSFTGAAGAITGSSAFDITSSSLNCDYTGGGALDRIPDSAPFTLRHNAELILNGYASAAGTETIGTVTLERGLSTFSASAVGTPVQTATLSAGTLTRQNNATAFFRGTSLGAGTAATVKFNPTLTGSLVGGSGSTLTNKPILPWAFGDTSVTGTGKLTGSLVTVAPDGTIRPLALTADYATLGASTDITDNAIHQFSATSSFGPGTGLAWTNNAVVIDCTASGSTPTLTLQGTLRVTGGTVLLKGSGNPSYFQFNSGAIEFGSQQGVIINGGVNGIVLGSALNVKGSGGLVMTGTLAYNAASANWSYTGGLTINGVGASCSAAIGIAGNSANDVTLNNGQLSNSSADGTTTRVIHLYGPVNKLNTSKNWSLNGVIDGPGGFQFDSSTTANGVLSLGGSADNTFTGGCHIASGTLRIDKDRGLGSVVSGDSASGALSIGLLSNTARGLVEFTSAAPVAGSLSGNSQIGAAPSVVLGTASQATELTVGGNGASTVFAGIIAEGGAGKGSLKKVGTGTLTLANWSTYSGATTITNGTLRLTDGASLAATSAFDVHALGTLDVSQAPNGFAVGAAQTLKGTGTVKAGTSLASGLTVNGTLAPGASAGTLAVDGALTLGGIYAVEIDGGTATADKVTVNGPVALGGNLTVTLAGDVPSGTFTVVDNTSASGATTGSFTNLPTSDDTLTVDGKIVRITYGAGADGKDVTLSVTSPGTVVLLR